MTELESILLEFYVYVEIIPRQLQHDVEIEFIVLDLAFQNLVYYTRYANSLNSFKNMLTNKYVWKMVLSANFGRGNRFHRLISPLARIELVNYMTHIKF